jgi:hypothetical protein
MIEGSTYFQKVRNMFSFLSEEYGVTDINEITNGNVFYDIEYRKSSKVISISYENIEDYLQVIVFKLNNGKLPDYEDKTQTLHLNVINKITFSKADKNDFELNNEYFDKKNAITELERKLLKSAKDLRLAMQLIEDLRV